MSALLRIERTSPLHSLQDYGRVGYSRFGLCQAGALDRFSMDWANRLLGNSAGQAVLELSGGGFVAVFSARQSFAVTGAYAPMTLNERSLLPWRSYTAEAGERLLIRGPSAGNHVYLSVAGGFVAPATLGSVATSLRDGLGGVHGDGRALMAGDVLVLAAQVVPDQAVPRSGLPNYRLPLSLRVHPSYQADEVDWSGVLSAPYRVSKNTSRMGVRLAEGPVIRAPAMEFSEPIALGAVQVPPDGQPIVLMNDRQSLGGYPKIGCVWVDDLYQLAQRRPGDWVSFVREPATTPRSF